MTPLERTRLSKRLTIAELAAKAEVSARTIVRIERDGAPMLDSTLFKLADALEVDPVELRGTAAPA